MTARKSAPVKPRAKKAIPEKTRSTKRPHAGPRATAKIARPHEPEPIRSKAPNGFIVVDGSNIANSSRADGRPQLRNIERVHGILQHLGYEPVVFVDASLRHQISESEQALFEDWEGDSLIIQVPRGVNGDEAILEFASRHDAPVLSNDNYQDLEERYAWVRDRRRRIPYNLVRGELILYTYQEPPAMPPKAQEQPGRPAPSPRPVASRPTPARPERAAPPTAASKQRTRRGDIPRASEAEWNELRERLTKVMEARVPRGESLRADELSQEIIRQLPGFRPNYYGSSSFTKLLDRMDDLFELARRGPDGQLSSLSGPQQWPIVVLRRD